MTELPIDSSQLVSKSEFDMPLNANQVAKLATGDPIRKSDSKGLYFVVPESGEPFWALRYTVNGKRRQMTLGNYRDLPLADARLEAEQQKKLVREGKDPLVVKERHAWTGIATISDVFEDWYATDLVVRLKHPHIPQRVFRKEIEPVIGRMGVNDVSPLDIREVIRRVKISNRPTIANDVLMYAKQLFRHAIKLGLTYNNPAAAFTISDAGGIENSRDRSLAPEEIDHAFQVFRENAVSFGRDNYLACCLILVLGVRKSELCEALWSEFDLEAKTWALPSTRSKTGAPIVIPLPNQAIVWLKELKVRALGSDYVFPARRSSKKPHMGTDTLNRAISKLFGHEAGRKVQPPNKMGDLGHFTVHDLRRSFRSLASQLGVPGHVAERCLNHKLQGVEGIYDRYDYYEERKQAHQTIADYINSLVQPDATRAKGEIFHMRKFGEESISTADGNAEPENVFELNQKRLASRA